MVKVRATQDAEKKRKAILDMLGYKRLQKVGSSYALLIPALWVSANAADIGGVPYVLVETTMDVLTLTCANIEDINEQLEVNNV